MPFTDIAPPPPPPAPGTGISLGLSIPKRGSGKVRLTIRADQQERIFGGPIADKTFSAQVGRGKDEGLLRLVMDPEGDLTAKASMKGSAFISMMAWDLLPKYKRPSGPCEVTQMPSNVEVIISLPSWAKPSGVGGKISTEFALKTKKAS